jgi:hypothetical protein
MNFPHQPDVWQRRDGEGDVMPWFTEGMLRVLDGWDMRSWRVFEYGAGYSSLWFAKRAAQVVSVDVSEEWVKPLLGHPKITAIVEPDWQKYATLIAEHGQFDLVVVDGVNRDQCLACAAQAVKQGGIVILDNAERAYARNAAAKLFAWCESHYYPQLRHPEWVTAYWVVAKERWDGLSAAQAAANERQAQMKSRI